jgi:hypothetical protein
VERWWDGQRWTNNTRTATVEVDAPRTQYFGPATDTPTRSRQASAASAPKRPVWRRGWFVAPVSALIGFGAGSAAGGGSGSAPTSAAPTVTVTTTVTARAAAAAAAAKPVSVAAVKPANATVPADSGNCYWARRKGDSGSLNDIIANNNSSGANVVTIKSSDKIFETNGCNPWTKVG